MTSQALESPAVRDVAFGRLQALVNRGYRPSFGRSEPARGAFFISLTHPTASKRRYLPRLALWSDGILATDGLLWPEHYVPSESQLPAWQKFILADDGATFDRFVSGVGTPTILDLYARPAWSAVRRFTLRLLLAVSLCAALAGVVWTIARVAGSHVGA